MAQVLYFETTQDALTAINYVKQNRLPSGSLRANLLSYLVVTSREGGAYDSAPTPPPYWLSYDITIVPTSEDESPPIGWTGTTDGFTWSWVSTIDSNSLFTNIVRTGGTEYNSNPLPIYASGVPLTLTTSEQSTEGALFIFTADKKYVNTGLVYFNNLADATTFYNNLAAGVNSLTKLIEPPSAFFPSYFNSRITFFPAYRLSSSLKIGEAVITGSALGANSLYKWHSYVDTINENGQEKVYLNTSPNTNSNFAIDSSVEAVSLSALHIMYKIDNNKGLLFFDNYNFAKSVHNYLVNQTTPISLSLIQTAVADYYVDTGSGSSDSNFVYQPNNYTISSATVGQGNFSLIGKLSSTTTTSGLTIVTFTQLSEPTLYNYLSPLTDTDGTSLYFLVYEIQNIKSYLYLESGPYVPYLVDLLKNGGTSNPNVLYTQILTSLSVDSSKYTLRYTNIAVGDPDPNSLLTYEGYAILNSTLSNNTLTVTEVTPGTGKGFGAYGDTPNETNSNSENNFVIYISPINVDTPYIVFFDTIVNADNFYEAYTTAGGGTTKPEIVTTVGPNGELFEPGPPPSELTITTSGTGLFSNSAQKWTLYNIIHTKSIEGSLGFSSLKPTQWAPISQEPGPFFAANLYFMYIFVPIEQTSSLTLLSGPRSLLKLLNKVSLSDLSGNAPITENIVDLLNPAMFLPNTTLIPKSESEAYYNPNLVKNTNYYFNLLDQNTEWEIVNSFETDISGYLIANTFGGAPGPYVNDTNLVAYIEKSFMTLLLQPSTPISCFIAGATVETDQGLIPIETIDPKKHTIDGKRIKALTKDISPRARVVTLVKNVISENVPDKDTVCTVWHKIKYKDSFRIAGQIPGLRGRAYKGEILYNILMDEVETIKINNMLTLTLAADHPIAKEYSN